MQKIEAEKLLTTILFETMGPAVILSDELIFQKCAEDAIIKKTQKRPKIFAGAQALIQYMQYVRQNDLFDPISDCIIILDENFTIKKESEHKNYFNDIWTNGVTSPHGPKPTAPKVFIFGKTALRHLINEKDFPKISLYLCYTPNSTGRQKCAEILAKEYTSSQKYNSETISAMAEQALVYYNNDLYHCALHFERMRKNGINFNDAILSDAPLSGFDIVQTLLEGKPDLLDMRLFQYAQNGGDTSQILRAMVYFFKQLALVHAELAQNSNLSGALLKAKIPYPAQNQIKKAIQVIPYAKIEHFFSIVAQLELNLRECKNPNQILFLEAMQITQAD